MYPRYLTKSRFKLALECPTKLFYNHKKEYYNKKNDDDFLQELARGGIQVGELAKQYFPGGIEIVCDDYWDYDQLIKLTNEQLKKDKVILYEAAIKHKNCFIRVDILEKNGNSIKFYEVKSKSFHPEKDINKNGKVFLSRGNTIHYDWKDYLYDVSFQDWVLNNSKQTKEYEIIPHLTLINKSVKTTREGLHSKFLIINKNNTWISCSKKKLTGKDLGEKILSNINVTEHCQFIEKSIIQNAGVNYTFPELIERYSMLYKNDEKHEINLTNKCKHCEFKIINQNDITNKNKSGFHECLTEYSQGDFDFSEPNILEIWDNRKINNFIVQDKLYQRDLTLEDLGKDNNNSPGLTRIQRQWKQIQISTRAEGKEYFNGHAFSNYTSDFKYPFHFIDFETCRVAIPFEANRFPYDLYTFQFSCHTLKSDGGIEHHQWINIDPVFPNFEFVRELKRIIRNKGTVFMYSHYENTVLNTIHNQLNDYIDEIDDAEELKQWIESITYKKYIRRGDRCMIDLRDICYWFYLHNDMRGSYSIKALLPAVIKSSKYLKEKYSKPLPFGSNLKKKTFWQPNPDTKEPVDPYDLLEPLFSKTQLGILSSTNIELLMQDEKIQKGGAAMAAYALMHFTQMSDIEKEALRDGLLNYCELDTLAMLMIWEHWNSIINNKGEK